MKVIEWHSDRLRIVDQTRLPREETYLELNDHHHVAAAIKEMRIRGAPAIGVAAAYGIALGGLRIEAESPGQFRQLLKEVVSEITATRPTAINLSAAASRMEQAAVGRDVAAVRQSLVEEAAKIHRESYQADDSLSQRGTALLGEGATVLTHCNTGPLATAGYGTALGVIMRAQRQGKKINVLVTETRPLCQGARLTTWELKEAGVPFKLITDSMAGHFMSKGQVDAVITGADRIAANGDTANKIGTYSLAVLAKENGVPFYVAAPTTTIDPETATGEDIPIEERSPEEVTHLGEAAIAPEGTEVLNPAFDVTPHRYITAIITEKGIIREPYGEGIGNI
ncbi:MAG: S-methyl-5-thioribose-1-phosphate isomerase [Dehalococcoidales bacterium]